MSCCQMSNFRTSNRIGSPICHRCVSRTKAQILLVLISTVMAHRRATLPSEVEQEIGKAILDTGER